MAETQTEKEKEFSANIPINMSLLSLRIIADASSAKWKRNEQPRTPADDRLPFSIRNRWWETFSKTDDKFCVAIDKLCCSPSILSVSKPLTFIIEFEIVFDRKERGTRLAEALTQS